MWPICPPQPTASSPTVTPEAPPPLLLASGAAPWWWTTRSPRWMRKLTDRRCSRGKRFHTRSHLTVWMLNDARVPSTGNFGAGTSSRTCSSSALQFSSRSPAGGPCRKQGMQSAVSSRLINTMSHLLDVAEGRYLLEFRIALSVLMGFLFFDWWSFFHSGLIF